MKKITLALGLLCCGLLASAQNGLEKIIVEKYYVSNADDSVGSIGFGNLPVGSVTYRIYADMLPGYKFQALYGVAGTEGDSVGAHELRISTTTNFFNNEDRGDRVPNGITVVNTKKNSVMIDSWFSVGAAAAGNMGVLKSEDTTGTIGNSSTPAMLQNNDTAAGIPINYNLGEHPAEDGMMAVSGSIPSVTFVGISDSALDIFNNVSGAGSVLSTYNGSVACLGGSMGATPSNTVLLGQFTTNGIFSFKLNIQIGDTLGGVENYVAENPVDSTEIVLPSLMYTSPPPVVDTTHDSTVSIHVPVVPNTSVSIYPNPATDALTLSISNSKTLNNIYSIYDAKGILIDRKQIGEISSNIYTQKLDISAYPQGLYVVVISLDGKVTTKKITKN